MAVLNAELAQIARDVITDMREENCAEVDVMWSACSSVLKYVEERELVDEPWNPAYLAAIQALVKQIMKEEQKPTLRECPYCRRWHEAYLIEACPLKPKSL